MKTNEQHYEIERKYLIKRPDVAELNSFPGAVRYEIEQIYLPRDSEGNSPRIRRRICNGVIECFYTVKRRINALKRVEDEKRIEPEVYDALRRTAGERPVAISKTRYCLPYNGRVVEIDIYPFWEKTAVAEVEMESEDEEVLLPDIINVIRDVTGEKRFLNRDMAKELFETGRVAEDVT